MSTGMAISLMPAVGCGDRRPRPSGQEDEELMRDCEELCPNNVYLGRCGESLVIEDGGRLSRRTLRRLVRALYQDRLDPDPAIIQELYSEWIDFGLYRRFRRFLAYLLHRLETTLSLDPCFCVEDCDE